MLQRVSVWLDDLSPEQGAFAHALEWALRMRLPLHGIILKPPQELAAPKLAACARVCAAKRVSWEVSCSPESSASSAQEFLRRHQLAVFGGYLSLEIRDNLLYRLFHDGDTFALVCPHSWTPVTR